ncbi:MAG: HAD family hydrolase [Deltaproteobacteria bacterium]|nr:HAD family hydrolase [Candidatus Anaeroferrophillus wilburensis]MBN2889045.1 HAD family hydrolase [Deltaproteobacteria bacterium]
MTAEACPAAVFLDRDGTVTEEVGYVNHVDRLKLIPGAAQAIRRLNETQIPVILVTNQAGVARGYFPESLVTEVHQRLTELLAAEHAHLDAIYYCPHHPTVGSPPYCQPCGCRKPDTGMVEQAIEDLNLHHRHFFVVGDKYSDIRMATRIGARGIFVLTGYGKGEYEMFSPSWKVQPDHIAADLLQATEWILQQLSRNNPAPPHTQEKQDGPQS